MLHMTSLLRIAVEFLQEVSRNVGSDREITGVAYFEFAFFSHFSSSAERQVKMNFRNP